MKNILVILCAAFLFACNNEASNTTGDDTLSSFKEDTSVLDPTRNRDESTPMDTMSNGKDSRDTALSSNRRDSAGR
jgi:hypothetical protein